MIVIKDKPIDKDELVSDYVVRIVEGMDIDTLCELAYNVIFEEKIGYEDGELLAEIEEYYPDLLEE